MSDDDIDEHDAEPDPVEDPHAAHAPTLAARTLTTITTVIKRQFELEALNYVLHCMALIALLIVVRPMFTSAVPHSIYQQPSVVWGLLDFDISLLTKAAQGRRPAVPLFLFLVIPTAVFLIAGRKVRWTDWEHGKAFRNAVMAILIMLAWSGSTFDYNIYLDQLHGIDRLLLIGATVVAWRTPLAVPFATRLAIVLIKESYVPIPQDDFDYRPTAELMVVLSAFTWASYKRSFKPKHFLLVALGAWASYYYVAGMSKWNYGNNLSWYYDNHLSNFAVSAFGRGWLDMLSDNTVAAVVEQVSRFDKPMAAFTLVVELGALVAFFLHPKLTKLWLLLCCLLNFGIFTLTGVFFWKWMLANIALAWWIHRGGAPVAKQMCRYWLVAAFGVLTVYYSANRIWYFPQRGVVWYDSPFVDDFEIHAVGASGNRYMIDPNFFAPSDMHWAQGALCYFTKERIISGIYGTTGSRSMIMRLQQATSPADAEKLLRRGGQCTRGRNVTFKKRGDLFLKTFFRNLNRHGKRPHRWITWLGRPTHLHLQPQGTMYDFQEPVEKIEIWREKIFHYDNKIHRWPRKLVYTLDIPK